MSAAILVLACNVVGLTTATPAYANELIDLAGQAFVDDRMYVDPDAADTLTSNEEEAIARRLEMASIPIYLAVLPNEALSEVGGDPMALVAELEQAADGLRGTYLLMVDEVFVARSNTIGQQATALADRVAAIESSPVGRVRTFVDQLELALVRAELAENSPDRDESSGIPSSLVLLGLALLAFGWLPLAWHRGRQHAVDDLTQVRRAVGDDIASLAADCTAVDRELQAAPVNPPARTAFAQARAAAERARQAAERITDSPDVRSVTSALEAGWYALAVTRAHLAGQPVPERRPPCLFDPRHGPAATYVDWAPSGIDPRPVPACRADAIRMSEGRSPLIRQVRYDGRRGAYWDAGHAFVSWAEGWYATEGKATIFTYLWGTPIGAAFDDPAVATAESPFDGWRVQRLAA